MRRSKTPARSRGRRRRCCRGFRVRKCMLQVKRMGLSVVCYSAISVHWRARARCSRWAVVGTDDIDWLRGCDVAARIGVIAASGGFHVPPALNPPPPWLTHTTHTTSQLHKQNRHFCTVAVHICLQQTKPIPDPSPKRPLQIASALQPTYFQLHYQRCLPELSALVCASFRSVSAPALKQTAIYMTRPSNFCDNLGLLCACRHGPRWKHDCDSC